MLPLFYFIFFLTSLWLSGHQKCSTIKLSQLNIALPSAGGSWCHDRLKVISLCLVSPWFSTFIKALVCARPLYVCQQAYLLTHGCQTLYHGTPLWLDSNNKLPTSKREVEQLSPCCAANSLELTMQKNCAVDFQRGSFGFQRSPQFPATLKRDEAICSDTKPNNNNTWSWHNGTRIFSLCVLSCRKLEAWSLILVSDIPSVRLHTRLLVTRGLLVLVFYTLGCSRLRSSVLPAQLSGRLAVSCPLKLQLRGKQGGLTFILHTLSTNFTDAQLCCLTRTSVCQWCGFYLFAPFFCIFF